LILAACGKKTPINQEDTQTPNEITSGETEIINTATDDTEVTEEDIKMIEEFLDEIIKSVESDGTTPASS